MFFFVIIVGLLMTASFTSGFLAHLVWQNRTNKDSFQRKNEKINEIQNTINQEIQNEFIDADNESIKILYQKLKDVVEDQKRIQEDIENRNLPRKIKRLQNEIKKLELTIKQITEDKQKIDAGDESIDLKQSKIHKIDKDIEDLKKSKNKLINVLENLVANRTSDYSIATEAVTRLINSRRNSV